MKNNNYINKPIGANPNSRDLREYKATLNELSQVELDVSIGNLLGDSSIQSLNKGKDHRIKLEWGNKEYAQHIFLIQDRWIIMAGIRKQVRKNHLGNQVTTWCFQSFSHPAFNILAKLFLVNGKKVKIFPCVYTLLSYINARVLAYWFMDDGCAYSYSKGSKKKPRSSNKNKHSLI